jgi:hypothetical protein
MAEGSQLEKEVKTSSADDGLDELVKSSFLEDKESWVQKFLVSKPWSYISAGYKAVGLGVGMKVAGYIGAIGAGIVSAASFFPFLGFKYTLDYLLKQKYFGSFIRGTKDVIKTAGRAVFEDIPDFAYKNGTVAYENFNNVMNSIPGPKASQKPT